MLQLRNPRFPQRHPVEVSALADMDLVVIPNERRVDINPSSPDFAAGYAK